MMGPYDIVVEIKVEGLEKVGSLLGEIRKIPGIESTTTLATFTE